MMFKQLISGAVITMLSLGVVAAGHDDDDDDDDDGGSSYGIGAVVAVKESIYRGGKTENDIHPRLWAQWGPLFIRGPGIGYSFYQDSKLELAAVLSLDFVSNTDRGDSSQLSDMGDLNEILLGGFEASYEEDWGEIDFAFGIDVLGEHDGYQLEFSYSYPFALGPWQLEPEAGLVWFSKEVTNYYYGVSRQYVRPDRLFYDPDSSFRYGFEVEATYPFAKHHAIQLEASYELYSKDITDSPIVDGSSAWGVSAGYIYRF